MASTDWTALANSLDSSVVRRGVTGGATPPNGGGTFVYGMRSTIVVNGVVAFLTNQTNFAPTPSMKGGSVRGAVRRAPSGGSNGFQPFLYAGGQNSDAAIAAGYILGLTDGDPHRIVLVKGNLVNGCPDVTPGSQGVLRRSTGTFALGSWLHLRLDMRVNANGDTVLSVFQNDLATNPVSAPVWAAVPGLEQIIDDVLGANTGTPPFTEGRLGFGCRFSDTSRTVFFDHLECLRET